MRKGMISEIGKCTQKLLVIYFDTWRSFMGGPHSALQG